MKKIFSSVFISLVSVFLLSACGQKADENKKAEQTTSEVVASKETSEETNKTEEPKAKKEVLTIYTWEGMFPKELLDRFTDETGIEINYTPFDYNETMLSKLEASKGGDYDLVIADDYIIETTIQQNLVQKLDKSKIPNFKNINPFYQKQFYDVNDEYTVPFGAGVQTIVYDPSLVDFEITGYSDLWNEKLKDNVSLVDNYRVINGMALKVLGQSYNTEDLNIIKEAGAKLLELAPNIRVISDSNAQDNLISGEVGAAVLYTSQVTIAKSQKPELKIVYPKEGIGFGEIVSFIPSNAPNSDAAHKFLSFMLEPKNSAEFFEFFGYYCTNKAAEEFIKDEFKDLIILPEGLTNGEMIKNISQEANDEHSKIWAEFKTAAGQ